MADRNQRPSLVQHIISPMTGELCCSKAVRPAKRKGEMNNSVSRYKGLRKTNNLVRTGCINCLIEGVKCDGMNPRCQKAAISIEWKINTDAAWQWQGTWRERRGVHAFMEFALSPQRAGLFESEFWHRTVIQACFQNEAVFHVASAIGALQQHIIQRSSGTHIDPNGLPFALHQCNRAINILVASAEDGEGKENDPGISLITCVLFAIFEALHGETDQAIFHSLQARKLLRNCESFEATGRGSQLIDPMAVRPVIGGLEIQAKAIQGRKMSNSSAASITPMPDAERIHGLEHANATLHHGYINLLIFCQTVCLGESPAKIKVQMDEKRDIFVRWFQQWERSFVDFLWREAPNLTPRDMQRAKVLKASHIAATLLATIDQGAGRDAWLPYNNDCKAIIDLSASVLSTYSIGTNATLSAFHFPFLTFGLWVAEPLFIVMSRCCSPELRHQAAGLLSAQPRANHAQNILIRSPGTIPDWTQSQRDTDEWDMDEWIEFAMGTRLDTAMATYFSRLPSEYIEKPVYSRTSA